MAGGTSPAKTSTATKKAKETATKKNNARNSIAKHPLVRDLDQGMSHRSLLTGLYGARGERIRHVVRNGALTMPREALQIMSMLEKKKAKIKNEIIYVKKKGCENHYELPALDSVVRPSLDTNLPSISVTYIYGKSESSPDASTPPITRTVTTNRTIVRKNNCETERIRGGGTEDVPDQPIHPTASGQQGGSTTAQNITMPNISSTLGEIPTQYHSVANLSSNPAHVAGKYSHAPHPQNPAWTTTAGVTPQTHKSNPPLSKLEFSAAGTGTTTGTALGTASPSVIASHSSPAVPSVPRVAPLKEKPLPQWEQHIPGPNDEMQSDPQSKPPKPSWYRSDKVSDLEKTLLPEWFDESALHRTQETYLKARETILKISDQLGNRFVTHSLVRRTIPGDAGSLYRLHNFLTNWFCVNFNGMNDSAPTPSALLSRNKMVWNDKRREELVSAVVTESREKRKLQQISTEAFSVDWDAIAAKIGNGASPLDCQRQFLSMPLNKAEGETSERLNTADTTMNESHQPKDQHQQDMMMDNMVRKLVKTSSPQVIRAVTEAALKASNIESDQHVDYLSQVQEAGAVGLMASHAIKKARSHEDSVAHLLAEIVDQRMEKLENRMALIDDLEGILEAERVALELERRDLYTARCREWFGGN